MKKIFALIATASLLFSCSQEDITSNFEKLPINISVGQQTRANDSTYENEDEVGIYVVNYDGSIAGTLAASGNQVDNERFTYNNSAWTPDETIYWKDQSTAADFYAYYPYSESVNISAHPFSVMADQSTEDNFWASDFLWGKATKVTPTSAAVPIVTNHSLSKILLAIEPGNGFTEESWAAATKSVKICNVKTNATIDLASGVATATGDDGEIVPFLSVPTTPGVNPSYKAMIVPQTIADKSKLIVVTVDGTEYVYRTGITFKANTQHRFVVTVNKKGGNVDVTIGEWEMDDFVNIGNAEEEDATIPNNQIWYTTTDETIVEPYDAEAFGANIISNTYDSGRGIITFDDDVISIGANAFYGCSSLTSITISDSVTEIETEAFLDCSSLTNFYGKFASKDNRCFIVNGVLNSFAPAGLTTYTIPDIVTSIEDCAFEHCCNLTSITIPDSVTSIGSGAFSRCLSLTNITIPNSVNAIETLTFLECRSLTNITIPSSVTSIGYGAFYYCSNLTSLTIPDSVISIGDCVFYGCSSLTSVTIPCRVTSIGNSAFSGCSNLTSITIPDSVTSIGPSAFSSCHSLTSIPISNSVTSIGTNAFSECHSLTSITIPDSVTSIGTSAFENCHSLTSFYGKFASKDNRCLIVNGVLNSFAPADLTTYTIPDIVTSIGYGAFSGCSRLTSITIPDNVTSIRGSAFSDCISLKSISIPANVATIEFGTFNGCSSLASITIPNSVTSIGTSAFSGCSNLTSIAIPCSVTSIGYGAFGNCSSLKEVYCEPTTPPNLMNSYESFANNASDRKFYVPRNSVDAYKSATVWSEYADCIVGYDF